MGESKRPQTPRISRHTGRCLDNLASRSQLTCPTPSVAPHSPDEAKPAATEGRRSRPSALPRPKTPPSRTLPRALTVSLVMSLQSGSRAMCWIVPQAPRGRLARQCLRASPGNMHALCATFREPLTSPPCSLSLARGGASGHGPRLLLVKAIRDSCPYGGISLLSHIYCRRRIKHIGVVSSWPPTISVPPLFCCA